MRSPMTHQQTRAARSGVGARGEACTARVLDGLASGDPSVETLHGLRAPGMGGRADLDHVVVHQAATGPVVLVLDSKVWAPGVYWSCAGRTFRGRTRFRPAQHVITRLAAEKLGQHLLACIPASKTTSKKESLQASRTASMQVGCVTMLTPLVVIWPSRSGRITCLHFSLGDGTPWCRGHDLPAYLARTLPPSSGAPPDPALVAVLARLQKGSR